MSGLFNTKFQSSQLATPKVVSLVAVCGAGKDVKDPYYLANPLSAKKEREIRRKFKS
jgi:hypothetical protein